MNNTLIKGLGLLERLARADRPLGVTEMAAAIGIGKSNAHRLLQALVALGYVARDERHGTYRATLRLWELGTALMGNLDLRRVAEPYMQRLLDRTRETVHLSALDGAEVVYLHKLDSPEPVRAYTQVGGRAPAHAVATGKALLAFQPEATLMALSQRLTRHTPHTLADPEAFLQEMARVRAQGYAINRGEWREAVAGIAAPILTPAGEAIGAIGVSGPIDRLRPSSWRRYTADVVEAARGVSDALAERPRAAA